MYNPLMIQTEPIKSTAVLSPCNKYRYQLRRYWGKRPSRQSTVVFVGLNPSTADATADDPTIRKCIAYARAWQFNSLIMVNLFAWRATDPNLLHQSKDPIGKQNDTYITAAVANASLIIACWGEHGSFMNRADELRSQYPRRLHCLKTNASGQPSHPLYLPASLTPVKLTKARPLLK